MREQINDKYIREAINIKLGKHSEENILNNDINKIKELNLNNNTFSGQSKDIDLTQIKELSNLSSLGIQYFEITDEIVEVFKSLENLEILTLISCKYTSEESLKLKKLKSLDMQFCDMKSGYNKIYAPETLRIQNAENVRFEKIQGKERIKNLVMNNCKISGFSTVIECTNAQLINIDGSKIDDKKNLLKMDCSVSFEKTSYPIN